MSLFDQKPYKVINIIVPKSVLTFNCVLHHFTCYRECMFANTCVYVLILA